MPAIDLNSPPPPALKGLILFLLFFLTLGVVVSGVAFMWAVNRYFKLKRVHAIALKAKVDVEETVLEYQASKRMTVIGPAIASLAPLPSARIYSRDKQQPTGVPATCCVSPVVLTAPTKTPAFPVEVVVGVPFSVTSLVSRESIVVCGDEDKKIPAEPICPPLVERLDEVAARVPFEDKVTDIVCCAPTEELDVIGRVSFEDEVADEVCSIPTERLDEPIVGIPFEDEVADKACSTPNERSDKLIARIPFEQEVAYKFLPPVTEEDEEEEYEREVVSKVSSDVNSPSTVPVKIVVKKRTLAATSAVKENVFVSSSSLVLSVPGPQYRKRKPLATLTVPGMSNKPRSLKKVSRRVEKRIEAPRKRRHGVRTVGKENVGAVGATSTRDFEFGIPELQLNGRAYNEVELDELEESVLAYYFRA